MNSLPENKERLWFLIVSPTIWALHFMLSYLTAAIWCAKMAGPGGSLGWVRAAIIIYTAFALAGIGITGWLAYRKHRFGNSELPHDFDSPEDRHRFLGFATVLLSALSAVATIYAALVAVFFSECH